MGEKSKLAVDCIRLSAFVASNIMSVALKVVTLPFIGQLDAKNTLQAVNQFGIAHRKNNFDAMAQVASHHVGAAKVNLLGSSIPEVVYATVL
jgi:hypothetical protein